MRVHGKANVLGWVFGLSLLLGFGCSSGTSAEQTAADDEAAFQEKTTGCSQGCCGSPYNCRVPDPERRTGCSGARLRNPSIGGCDFPLRADGDLALMDGFGTPIGQIQDGAVKLNQGIRKRLDGRWLVYVFGTHIRTLDGRTSSASGWMWQATLVHADAVQGYTLALTDPHQGTYAARWRTTTANRDAYEPLHLVAPTGEHYPAHDYLVRPYGLVHLTYSVPGFNLGGQATDSFPPGTLFRRSRGVSQIEVPLYGPRGYRSERSLHFIYGYVYDGEQRRYGWLAKEAMELNPEAVAMPAGVAADPAEPEAAPAEPGAAPEPEDEPEPEAGPEPAPAPEPEPAPAPEPAPEPAAPPPDCSARCCDQSVQSGLAAASPQACIQASGDACDAHGHVLRTRFDGEVVYGLDRRCWALCAHRAAYHVVEGVVEGCTDEARAWCAQSDRGGLTDAAWSECQP